jgi:hypothetical protein
MKLAQRLRVILCPDFISDRDKLPRGQGYAAHEAPWRKERMGSRTNWVSKID